jgi:hypothetical protein
MFVHSPNIKNAYQNTIEWLAIRNKEQRGAKALKQILRVMRNCVNASPILPISP